VKECTFCYKQLEAANVIRYNRTGYLGFVCAPCEANVFEEPTSLWTIVGAVADGITHTWSSK